MLMHTFTDPEDNFIITSPTFPIISQSTLPPFLRLMEGLGKHNKQANNFEMTGGGTCWFRTGRDPDSIVGIPNVRGILCDEAGLYSLYFWENIQGRSDAKAAPIMIVTSPYALNWLYKDIIKPKLKDANLRPDVTLIQAKSVENPNFNTERYYARQKIMDPRRFNMMYGGEWNRMAGLVYDCFDEVENQCDDFSLPAGTTYYAGVDWGFSDPFVMKIRAITPDGRHYGVHEFYKTGLTISDMVGVAKRLHAIYNLTMCYCDPSQPGSIEEFNRNGVPAIGAVNDIRLGIDRHYELLKTRRLKYVKGQNPYTMDETDTYHYPSPDDLSPDQNAKDIMPVQQADHCMDAERYISVSTHQSHLKNRTFVPQDEKKVVDHRAELQRLLKPKVKTYEEL